MRQFVTGAAGFIGFHLSRTLLDAGHDVLGFDAVTPYYDPRLKRARLKELSQYPRFTFVEGDLADAETVDKCLGSFGPDQVFHLAAQAGVRYSLENPEAYISANIVGSFNLFNTCKALEVKHLLFASTSSVYGGNQVVPFSEGHSAHFPVSLYAATKKAGEVMSHTYSHLYSIPTTCFRFFTVYGPWGRPDMALYKFLDRMDRGDAIEIYGHGQMSRSFTYVDDLVQAIQLLAANPPVAGAPAGTTDTLSPVAPWRVVNIAGNDTVPLIKFVEAVESVVGVTAKKQFLPMQPGDVTDTASDTSLLRLLTGYVPSTELIDGVREFVDWHRQFNA